MFNNRLSNHMNNAFATPQDNHERLLRMVEEIFATSGDPRQLNITPEVIDRLKQLHPSTVLEHVSENGTVAWVVLIPTTLELMNRFVAGEISEKELFELTPLGIKYEALYLCSALVLEEYRRQGIVKQMVTAAAQSIRKEHPLKAIFVWPFTKEGELAAESIATTLNLPLYKFQHDK